MHRVGFGLVGYGAWGSHHARAISECHRARLAGIADGDEEARRQARETYPDAEVVEDYRQLLTMPEVEAVDIVLPNDLHHEVGRAVLSSGRHLPIEKPMALTELQCGDLIEEARARNLHLGVAHQFRFSSMWGRIKELIDSGAIGDPRYVNIELWRNPYRQGWQGWRYNRGRVGNWILEEPIHFLDLARWYLARWGEPVSVYARANARRDDAPELQDNFSAIVNFPDGRFAVVSQTLSAYEHHLTLKITGSQGGIWGVWGGVMDRTWNPTFVLRHFDGHSVREVPLSGPAGEVYELSGQIADMAGAVGDGRSPSVSGEDGRWAVAMCLKAQESADTGAVVCV
jgi:myo-inositol 2-dehydrogenase / D-chiro-inositol 1-dehydrogenase